MKIGIIREEKTPIDHRVPFTPLQCKAILQKYPEITLVIQPSDVRSFKDSEYQETGIKIQEDLSDCDILFGVKEVPVEKLIAQKTYFFFSHTIKKQSYNQLLLKNLVEKKIRMIDYECLTNSAGTRLVAFGRFAELVGTYNAFRTYGLKKEIFELKPAHKCLDFYEMQFELSKIKAKIKGLKVLLTGSGRVAKGAIEILEELSFHSVDIEEFRVYQGNCFLQLESYDYNHKIDGGEFSYDDFFTNPTLYESTFDQYLSLAKIFVAGAYWDPKAPKLFELKDIQDPAFAFEVIADITCDINGSIPTTVKATSIAEPFYDFNKKTLQVEKAFSNKENISIMAVDNLPCELPRDSSEAFGNQLIEAVLPALFEGKKIERIDRASICQNGKLTERFSYLQNYLEGK